MSVDYCQRDNPDTSALLPYQCSSSDVADSDDNCWLSDISQSKLSSMLNSFGTVVYLTTPSGTAPQHCNERKIQRPPHVHTIEYATRAFIEVEAFNICVSPQTVFPVSAEVLPSFHVPVAHTPSQVQRKTLMESLLTVRKRKERNGYMYVY